MPDAETAYTRDETRWAAICHLSGLAGYVIPFGHLAGPLIIWLAKRKALSLVEHQGREALNFQISMTIYLMVAGLLTVVVVGGFLVGVLVIAHLLFMVLAAIRTSRGMPYRYPLTIRLL